MLGYIWAFMIVGGVVFSFITGKSDGISASVMQGADKAIQLIISIAGSMCLWTGIMNIADRSGLSEIMKENKKACSAVCANVTANLLGLGNAATPLGIKAMKELRRLNTSTECPDNTMIMFVVINTASLQLIPTTAAALRQAAGSSDPYSILPAVWISSLIALAAGITAAKLFGKASEKKRHILIMQRS